MNKSRYLNVTQTAFKPQAQALSPDKQASFGKAMLLGLGLLAAPLAAQAKEWQYWGPYDANTGVPKTLVDMSSKMPADLKDRVLKKLPEGVNIKNNPEIQLTDDLGANLYLVKDATVTVAFVDEGAGYLNALGFFEFKPDSLPTRGSDVNEKIIFPNFSKPQLKYGDAVELGAFKAGSAIGFTLAADAWKPSLRAVDPNQSTDWIFRTIKSLNPEIDDNRNLRAHTVLLSNSQDGLLILGLEDINRQKGGDHDFNDAIIAIHVTPFSAVDRSQLNDLSLNKDVNKIDTDGDTVPDYLDVFPKDPKRSAQRFYPSASGYGRLAFEDQWPRTGDYDLNDIVVNYRSIETLNAKNQIVDVEMIYEFAARGGANHSGFGVHLQGVGQDEILAKNDDGTLATSLVKNNNAAEALAIEAGQKEAVFIIAPDVNTITETGKPWPCNFFNPITRSFFPVNIISVAAKPIWWIFRRLTWPTPAYLAPMMMTLKQA
ncbi:MAG: LruC domain-containing protein [Methylococcales bacterium]|nr:LruC domain-containing protein [Methylococcales bacterium]